MPNRFFGHIPGVAVDTSFASRNLLSATGVHRPNQAGISGSGKEGADSIVLSGGYEDDQDHGDVVIYTGHGGRDPNTGNQVADQTFTRGNLALAVSQIQGLPVRVVRGADHKSTYSPKSGYRYDGLYRVEDHWREKGKSGHYVWRFRLVKLRDGSAETEEGLPEDGPYEPPERRASTILRIIRDTKQAREVKQIHYYKCQICELRLETKAGPYAEAAHIRPLGEPHRGPDARNNILCLCPNHHVLFDLGAFSVNDDGELIGLPGTLRTDPKHKISSEHLKYHREHYLNASP